MPTDKKRINLTLPDEIYSRLQVYRNKYGIASDAGACLQLIVRQLDSIETGERMMQMVSRFSEEELQQMTSMSIPIMKQLIDSKQNGNTK